jgi:release factor glutamine methyltransferase
LFFDFSFLIFLISIKILDKIWKIIDVLSWGKDFFASKNIDSPRLNIEMILCKVLKIERIKLYTNFDLPMNPDELAESKSLILRRLKGEPLQYLLGSTSFMGFEINLDKSVLIPRPETEELVELVLKIKPNLGNYSILDIGTGSGCISIALAKYYPESRITAIDISEESLNIAKINAESNNVSEKISFENKDILKNFNFKDKFDIIVSNPPYISINEYKSNSQKEIFYEPKNALTDNSDGLTFYRRFADEFDKHLNEDGCFLLEMSYNQSEEIESLFNKKYDIELIKDFNGILRFVSGIVKK